MSMLKKLDYLLEKRHMNKSALARETGIPYTTIDGYYKRGTDNIKLSNLKKLAEYFDVSLDYLVDDEISIYSDHNQEDCSDTYYINEDVVEYAEEIARNNEMKVLFDASKDVSKEDMEFVITMLKKLKKN